MLLADSYEAYVEVVAYLALFFIVGIIFVFFNLLLGRFVRADNPDEEKLEIYECGEPTIGSSYVQFDLRFYVVALLFIIFDVEVAFFYPWATVFGKANHMADTELVVVEGGASPPKLSASAEGLYRELGISHPTLPGPEVPVSLEGQVTATNTTERQSQIIKSGSRQMALVSIVDIGVFFAVLLVGFFYVWKRGDLDWVRAVSRERTEDLSRGPPNEAAADEPVLSA